MSDDYHLGGANGAGTWMPDIWQQLIEKYHLKSVIDVGCAQGGNTKWFFENGLDVLGVEGLPEYVLNTVLEKHCIVQHDYTLGPYIPNRFFDLGWSSEFVEHVEARFIENFMATFRKCTHICLTHATPGQGGFHHVNEQPTEYWIEKFGLSGFIFDADQTAQMRATGPNTAYGRRTLTMFHKVAL